MMRRISAGILAVTAGIAAAAAAGCTFDIIKVQGTSMEPAIKNENRILVNRMSYFLKDPGKGDVVAFYCDVYSEDGEGSILLRRVIAEEGDDVEIRDGNLYVNGECYVAYAEKGVYLEPMKKTEVGKDKVFVLSDTGQAVLDSRDQAVGQLRTDELIGRVCFK